MDQKQQVPRDGGSVNTIFGIHKEINGDLTPIVTQPGMSLRDYFAAAALTGIHASYTEGYPEPETAAKKAYAHADAMLRERAKD